MSPPDAGSGPDDPERSGSSVAFEDVVDPDVDLHDARQRAETRPRQWDLVLATALGGILGAEARYGVSVAIPHDGNSFPWSTLLINASGSLAIGLLMVVLLDLTSPHRLMRPFLGVGVLGGYTTYSTFAVDVQRLVVNHHAATALAYVVATVAICVFAVWLSMTATLATAQVVIDRRVRRRDPQPRSSP